MTRHSREQDVNDVRVTLYQCRSLVVPCPDMYAYVRVMYVKYGRCHMTTWGIYTHVMVAFGMALYGRAEGLACAAWMVPAMHGARQELVNLLYQIIYNPRNISLYARPSPCSN